MVGGDWADGPHDVVVPDRLGHTLWAGQIDHTREAWEGRLLEWAHPVRTDVRVVIETSPGVVGDGLNATGFGVYPVNPRVSEARRQPSGTKTDRLDAALVARLGWTERDPRRPWRPADEAWVAWRPLPRIDEDWTPQATRLTHPRLAALKSYYPQGLAAFADIRRPVALAFVAAWPDPQEARRPTVSAGMPGLRQPRDPHAAKAAHRLGSALQQRPWEASPGQRQAPIWAVRALVAPRQTLQTEHQALREPRAELFLTSPAADLWRSVPGVAVTWGARPEARLGTQRDRFDQVKAVQAGVGTRPVLYHHGKR
ncbi:MAG: transposase [Firmicutes bacterium]|nr:transposase [Bacillota bacterium]